MMLQFFLTDISYQIMNGKAVIHLYGRMKDGKVICIHDDQFEPYFLVLPKDVDEAKRELKDFSVKDKEQECKVVRIEDIRKKVNEHEQHLLKVFVNVPTAVMPLKEIVRKFNSVKECYEYDIKFTRRYLLDKGLSPWTLIEADAESYTERSRVPVFRAKSVSQAGDETYIKPNIMSVDIETYNSGGKVQMEKDPILMLALYGDSLQKVITWKRFPTEHKYIEFVATEADMLQRFKELLEEHKPDILAGYYSDGFDLPFIAKRAEKYKIKLDIGLDGTELNIEGRTQKSAQITGIVHVDIYKFIKKVIGRSMKTDSFTLDAVAKELIGEGKTVVDLDELSPAWDRGDPILNEFAKYNLQDTKLTYDLCIKVLPNIIEFVKIVGLPLWDINRMSFSQLVEWYIIKQAQTFNEVILNRPLYSQESARMQKRFKGALVFEPTPGVFDDIVVFDYRSLYPSIIASHNISIGTVNCECCKDIKPVPFDEEKYWFCTKKRGFMSVIIEDLITRRARIKTLIKTNKDPLLAARSEALKVLSNSFYGYLGFAPARWYCFECGQSVTAYSRYYISMVISEAQKEGFRVLYSDTDSVFLLLGKKKKDDALKFAERINRDLPKLMELDYESHYPRGIFVAAKSSESGAKKKYAMIDDKGKLKIRGFETVRRNTSFIAKDVQRDVLQIVLAEGDGQKAASHVKKVIADLKAHLIPKDKVVIFTQMTKTVDEYENISPHVAAAKRMMDRGMPVAAGTIVKYIVMQGKGKIRDRIKLEDEAEQDGYDAEYYIEHQVLAAVERIFDVLGIQLSELEKKGSQSTLGNF